MTVSKRTRYEVLRRDNHTCRYCGASAPDAKLTVDHVTPTALGGSDSPDNLVAACRDCNYGKASTSPADELVADIKAVDLQWAGAMKRAARIRADQRRREDKYVAAFGDEWERWGGNLRYADPTSVEQLYRANLPLPELLDAVRVAMTTRSVRDEFSYCMGVAWKRLSALQDTAKQLLAADEGGE